MPLTMYKRGRFWWLSGCAKTRNGHKRVHESTGQIDRAAADQIRFLREKDFYDALVLGSKATFTFAQAVDAYLRAGKSDRFVLRLRHHFGQTRISDMNGNMVRDAAKVLYPDAAYASWNRQVVTTVKAIINYSADAGCCPPVKIKGFMKKDRVGRRSSTPPKRAVDRAYIDKFRKHSDDPRLSALILFMFQTGARISDALKLEEDSPEVDLANRKVIFRDMKNGDDGEADLTIEMVYEIQQLREWKQRRREEWERSTKFFGKHRSRQVDLGRGARKPNDRLFGYLGRGAVYKDLRRICAAAGIPYLGTHQPGRHSFATEMIVRHNIDVATTAAKGRWKSKAFLMANYVHAETGPSVIDQVFGNHVCVAAGSARTYNA